MAITICYSDGGRYITARDGDFVIGGLELDMRDNEAVEIAAFWVEPPYQGKGIGQLLIQKAIALVEYNGFQRITVLSAYDYGVAMHIYQKFGFDIVWEESELLGMEKRL